MLYLHWDSCFLSPSKFVYLIVCAISSLGLVLSKSIQVCLFNRVVLYLPSYKFPCLFLSLLLVNMNKFSDTSYTEVIRSLHYCGIKYPSIVFMNMFKQASHVSQNDFIV